MDALMQGLGARKARVSGCEGFSGWSWADRISYVADVVRVVALLLLLGDLLALALRRLAG